MDTTATTSTVSGHWHNGTRAMATGGASITHYVHAQAIDRAGNESEVIHGAAITTTANDSTAPNVSGVRASSGYHKTNDTLTLTVSFDESVTVTGSPSLKLTIGANNTLSAGFSGTAGTPATAHTFEYTVAANLSGDPVVTGFNIDASNKIEDGATTPNSVSVTLSAPMTALRGSVDSTPPTLSGLTDDDFPTEASSGPGAAQS